MVRISVQLHKQVYIPSIEASDVYANMYRDRKIKFNYVGMIPSSLELNKLVEIGLKIIRPRNKHSENLLSNDLINVKFKQKAKSIKDTITDIKNKISKIEGINSDYSEKLRLYINKLENESDLDQWKEVKVNDLRKLLYTKGFTLTYEDPKTKNTVEDKYVVYKRSSAKSRVGQCLFIREHLYREMISWSRMYLTFGESETDLASLLAYESLVGSSLESLIRINPKNILIVDDIESRFTQLCNVVRKGEDGFLDSFGEKATITNSLFDGESLLDSSYFEHGSMKLLRNHMFKSAAFNTNIQQFLRDSCPANKEYNKWKIKNMFGQSMYAKDVHLIITPSSLKALKFSYILGSDKEMWDYWKGIIRDDKSLFGVCKSEKKSKLGEDNNGNILQQTSYQMLNSLPMSPADLSILTNYEIEYINNLKNDDEFFIYHLSKNISEMNSNEMLIELYRQNKEIVNTKLFREFRSSEIKKHVTHVKHGKIRIPKSDYCVMLGNPMEFLRHAIGKFKLDGEHTLKENEVYTKLFEYGRELVGFRNPHTSPSNVIIVKNTYNTEINRYFNLSDNIVCVNAINFPLQDILSGCDYDSDTVCLFDNTHLLKIAKKCYGRYRICINQVASSKKKYRLNYEDMATIDNQLSTSQMNIGSVVNLGQRCMSTYWDIQNNAENNDLSTLLRMVDVLTVLSGICIDLAKKFYDIDINKEIKNIEKNSLLRKEKPLFWKYVSQNDNVSTAFYNCPMDYLFKQMSNLKAAEYKKNTELLSLLIKRKPIEGSRTKQQQKIEKYVGDMNDKIGHYYLIYTDEEERNIAIDNAVKYYTYFVAKLTVNEDTMYSLLSGAVRNKSRITTRLFNALFKTQRKAFINAFYNAKM